MASVSSPGIGSGLNIQSIVSQLVAVEQQPVKLLQTKVSTLQTKLSTFGQVKSELASLQDAAKALMDSPTWDAKTLTSSSTAITGSATSSALNGSFSVQVSKLASGQSLKTAAVASNYTAPVSGTLQVQLGSWGADGSFPNTPVTATINVNAGDSLATIASNINAVSKTAGITATVVTSGATQQLLLRSNATGANAGFQITASTGLEAFGYASNFTPAVTDGQGAVVTPASYGISGSMTQTQAASDASILIDGVAVSSATNTVTDAVPGVSLNLTSTTTTPVQITVGTDLASIKSKIQAFQDAYNKLNADLKTQTAYDATTKSGGPLLGDSTVNGLQTMMRSLIGAIGPNTSTINRLSDLGVQIQADGSLATNSTKLDAALQNTDNVKAFFATNTATNATASGNGIARRFYDFLFAANGINGIVTAHSNGFQKQIDQNNKSIDKLNAHVANYQKQLLSQYTALDAKMSQLTSLGNYVTQQVTQWNKSG